jgi:hypothetical protein
MNGEPKGAANRSFIAELKALFQHLIKELEQQACENSLPGFPV